MLTDTAAARAAHAAQASHVHEAGIGPAGSEWLGTLAAGGRWS